jgi:hypothetical protein
MSAKIKRELELKVLSGGTSDEYTGALLLKGLQLLRSILRTNEAVITAVQQSRGKRSAVARHKLPYGAVLELSLLPTRESVIIPRGSKWKRERVYVVARIKLKSGGRMAVYSEEALAGELAQRIGGNAELLIGLVAMIERARRQLLGMIEEGSRWLP